MWHPRVLLLLLLLQGQRNEPLKVLVDNWRGMRSSDKGTSVVVDIVRILALQLPLEGLELDEGRGPTEGTLTERVRRLKVF